MNYEDFKCLLDHLSKESFQLLRKSDRCSLLLKIILIEDSSKYVDQLIGLLLQLPIQEDEIKFEISLKVMEIIMKKRRIKSGNEEFIYKWMKIFVELNPEKEIQFYSIKLRHDEIGDDDTRDDDDNTTNSIRDDDNTNSIRDTINARDDNINSTQRADNTNNILLENDLQKLKIFESFQM